MFNKKCTVEYDGTFFSGWQIQSGVRTIQGEITRVLSKIYKHNIIIYGAGRTDAKVHAEEQVFNFKSDRYIDCNYLMAGMNSLLPEDIVIKSVTDVLVSFHARKYAKMKTYSYRIFNNDVRSAFYASKAWWVKSKLNLTLLERHLKNYEGEKDFKNYCKNAKVYANTIRIIYSIELKKELDFITIKITANGFLRRMVRNIVGTTVMCNIYKKSFDDVVKSIYTAPSHGLYLTKVIY
jgi:tRNA pseudouridine38-40 synthase